MRMIVRWVQLLTYLNVWTRRPFSMYSRQMTFASWSNSSVKTVGVEILSEYFRRQTLVNITATLSSSDTTTCCLTPGVEGLLGLNYKVGAVQPMAFCVVTMRKDCLHLFLKLISIFSNLLYPLYFLRAVLWPKNELVITTLAVIS